MDQAVEATAAFAVFVIAFALTQGTIGSIYGSLINEASSPSLKSLSCIVASSIAYENGGSTGKWLNWSPCSSADHYLELEGTEVSIRVTCYRLTPAGEVEVAWVKEDPSFAVSECYFAWCIKAVQLDDGSFLSIEVFAR
ncbi:MAG: hypothetical protein QFX34_02985 [Candidatus Verstraetearchaeota archaeon]|nr:hypothetical protein [Candidatus Verstraetearchaeota archaeon]